MARAHGIAVIPHVVKGAFGIGGQWGKGLMSQRHEDGSWSQALQKVSPPHVHTDTKKAETKK